MAVTGEVQKIIGPVVDVSFSETDLPDIYTALKIADPEHGLLPVDA